MPCAGTLPTDRWWCGATRCSPPTPPPAAADPAGASAGIGEACAERFAAEGCKLVLVARREERLAALKARLTVQHGVAVHTVTLDVRDLGAVQRLPAQLPAEFQVCQLCACSENVLAGAAAVGLLHDASRALPIQHLLARSLLPPWPLPSTAPPRPVAQAVDILIPNAGLALGLAPVHELDVEDVRAMVDTNVTSVMVLVCVGWGWDGRGGAVNVLLLYMAHCRHPGCLCRAVGCLWRQGGH